MRNVHWSRSRLARRWRLDVERLEARALFAVQAVPLPFTPSQTAHAAGRVAAADDFALYAVSLGAGDVVNAAVSAQSTGSGLQSVLRVFDPTGHQIALDDQEGGDPRLTFQAPAAGDYLVGISSTGDDTYDPTAPDSGQGGTTTGPYALDLRRALGTALTADLAGGSVRLATGTAAYGDTISGTFTVDNRGGADAGAFDVQVVLSSDNRFGPASLVLTTFSPAGLGTGQEFSPGGFTVTLPDLATATGAGLPSSGPVYLGLRIDPAGAVPELNPRDQSGVHRGADFETLTLLTPVPAGVTDLSRADPRLDTRADGTLLTPGQADGYTFTITGSQGSGRLTAAVTPTARPLTPLLTLAGPDGDVLIQSGAQIVQHLQPGRYTLTVSARSGAGGYRLTSQFVPASPPGDPLDVGTGPGAVAVADLNGDGIPDLVTANRGVFRNYGDTLSVLLGNGDGTFRPQQTLPVGYSPSAVAVADLNGDGVLDIITADKGDDTVSVLPGNGDGTFRPQQTFTVGSDPHAVVVADLTGDGIPDIITANSGDGTVTVLPGNGDGTFQPPQAFPVGGGPDAVAVADLTGDGKLDIITANDFDKTVSVLVGNSYGTFRPPQTFPVGSDPDAVAVADLTGKGKLDVITANAFDNTVSVLLQGGESFTTSSAITGVPLRDTPFLADLTGDGIPDSVVLDRFGNILFRKGLPGSDNQFAPPVILNPGRPARDLALVNTPAGPALAAADTHRDPTLATPGNPFVYTVSLYTVSADGTVTRTTAFSTPFVPTRIAAGDLTGDGLDDLVVADSFDNRVQVALQQPDGTFSAPLTLTTGEAPSDISLTDVNGDGLLDIVVTDQGSGDVTVFLNDPGSFATSYRLRAGAGPYRLDPTTATPAVSSLEEPVSLAAGDFTGDGRNDLVVLDRGSDSFTVLPNDGSGGFADPQAALTTSTSDGFAVNAQAGPLVAGHFNGPNRPLDLAVLMPDSSQVWVYTGDGHGHFTHTFSVDAGTSPTGLSVVPGSGPGLFDLLVGDEFGDVLRLVGDGRGDFQPPPPVTGDHAALDVQPLGPGGSPEALVADQKDNLVTIQAPQPGTRQFIPIVTLADGTQSTLAPGAVHWAKLDKGSPYYDAVVVASGANAILVYRGTGFDATGNPTFAAPVGYPVGTDPVSVTIQDVTGDGIPDMLVADQGSNDVAELFGSYGANGDWGATPGPRLKCGGSGPVAVSVRDVTGNGIPDLVVTNGQSGTFTVLPGVGQGFFNDQNPQVLNVPGNPVLEAPSFFGTSNQGVVATADGRLIGFDLADFAASVGTVFAPPDGVAAVEALADGDVVAALEGGTVVELAPSNGGLVVAATFQSLTGIPSDPSALEVLEGASGLQVLVTNAGGDRVYVFGIPGLPESPALPPAEVAAGPAVEVTPPVEGSLTLVVTLVAGPVPAGGAAVADAPQDAGPAPAPPAEAALPWNAGGAEEVAAAAGDDGPRPGEGGIDVPEQLRGIDLYQPPPAPDRPGLISQRPDAAGRRDRAVIALSPNGSRPPVTRALTAQPPADPEPAEAWTPPAEVVRAAGDDTLRRATAGPGEAADAVFALPPSRWLPEHARLMALAAFVGWAWSGRLLYAQSQGAEVTAGRRPRRIPQIRARG